MSVLYNESIQYYFCQYYYSVLKTNVSELTKAFSLGY